MKSNIAAIVLAAGRGTRIHAVIKNKVLLPLAGKPMIGYTLDLLQQMPLQTIIVVVEYKKQGVIDYLGPKYVYVRQKKLLGTGHAVRKAVEHLKKNTKHVIVLYGDHSAFYEKTMLENLLRKHISKMAAVSFITVDKKDPSDYGRIIRDRSGKVIAIREEKDANSSEKKIKEINTGAYCFSVSFLQKYLHRIKKNPLKGEYYLTDLIAMAVQDKLKVNTLKLKNEIVSLGINTGEELETADRAMRQRLKS